MFTLVNGILIQPLPYPEADRLVVMRHAAPGLDMPAADQSEGTFLHYWSRSRVFEDMAVYNENVVSVTDGEGDPERVQVALVSPSFFSTLQIVPVRGRLFTQEDSRPGAPGVVLLSHDLWTRRYGADPGIVGRSVELNRMPKQVVGILPPGFGFPQPETQIWYATELDHAATRLGDLYLSGIGRLKPGVSPEEAEADLDRLIPSLADRYADATAMLQDAQLRAIVKPLKEVVVGGIGSALWVLLGGIGFVLLIACANIVNLVLVRAEHRQKEVAVRMALGASRGDIVRYFVTESLVLAILGGVLGLVIADAAVRLLIAFGPENLPRLHEVRIDGRVLAFTAGLAILASLLFGAVPVFRRGPDPASALKAGGGTANSERQRARRLLVASQVALALTLLVGSALMVRSFWNLRNVDPGFDPEGVLTLELALPYRPYPTYNAAAGFYHRLLEGVRALPGVESAGAVSGLPLVPLPSFYDEPLAAEGDGVAAVATHNLVTPGYFEALRIPLVEGRAFEPGDRAGGGNPVLVSSTLARRLFPGESALGKRVRRAAGAKEPWYTVVGIVGSVPKETVGGGAAEVLYFPVWDQAPGTDYIPNTPTHMSVVIRTSLPPASLGPAVRRIVRDLDPDLPIANIRTMERIVADTMARTSFTMALLLIAAVVALLLGAVGIYGVISYAVSRRTREIGIRIALGAQAMDVSRLVLRQGTGVVLAGLGAGVLAALALTRFLRVLLFEVSPTDPTTFIVMSLLLLTVALLASYLPARRAARVDPMIALRSE